MAGYKDNARLENVIARAWEVRRSIEIAQRITERQAETDGQLVGEKLGIVLGNLDIGLSEICDLLSCLIYLNAPPNLRRAMTDPDPLVNEQYQPCEVCDA